MKLFGTYFDIQPPAWTMDRTAYEKSLETFLELNSNFIQQNEKGDAAQQASKSYTIQVWFIALLNILYYFARYVLCFSTFFFVFMIFSDIQFILREAKSPQELLHCKKSLTL